MSFISEIKRRNVVKVGLAYLALSWLLIQLVTTVDEPLGLPSWFDTFVIVFLAVGFPVALVLSWAFELTPEGIRQTENVAPEVSVTPQTGRKLTHITIGVLAMAVALLLLDRLVLDGRRDVMPNSIAVLPFENLSPDRGDAYFAPGLHEEILNRLEKIQNLTVIARTTMAQYEATDKSITEIADELNVETVMEGSVRFANDVVRVTAQLIDPATGGHLWSETYERPFKDIFAIESDVAMNVANALRVEFSVEEQHIVAAVPTSSPEAYRLYLRSLEAYRVTQEDHDFGVAHRYLDQAIALDPQFALAYARKAYLYSDTLYFGGAEDLSREQLESAALRNASAALEFDENIGLAYAAQAGVYEVNWRWTDARNAYEMALRLSPSDVDVITRYAFFNRAIGEYSESVRLMQRAIELDPADDTSLGQLAVSNMIARNYDGCLEASAAVMRVDPNPITPIVMANCLSALGRFEEAVEMLRLSEGFGEPTINNVAWLALAYARAGRPEEADRYFEYLEETDEPVGAAHWAMAYLGQGDEEETYDWLRQAIDDRTLADLIFLIELKSNLWQHPMLDTPRFRELRSQIGSLD